MSCAGCRSNTMRALRSLVAGLHHYLDAEGIRSFPAVQELCNLLGLSEEERLRVANLARPPAPEQQLVHQAYHQAQLRSFLGYAVPRLHLRWLEEGRSVAEVIEMARATADVIAHEGGALLVDADTLTPKANRQRRSKSFVEAREALAVACAGGAFVPGGITCMEMHWEVPTREWEVALRSVAELRKDERRGPQRSPNAPKSR